MRGRLFVALDLDERSRDFVASAIDRLKAAGVDARFGSRDKWHVTVAFLGPVEEAARPDVMRLIKTAAARCRPFDLVLDAVGAFPNRRRPRVVWVGSVAAQPAYGECAADVRDTFAGAGFRFENDAVPHVTVCRLKNGATALPLVTLNGSATQRIDHLALYESIPAGPSTTYVRLERAPFGTTAASRAPSIGEPA